MVHICISSKIKNFDFCFKKKKFKFSTIYLYAQPIILVLKDLSKIQEATKKFIESLLLQIHASNNN